MDLNWTATASALLHGALLLALIWRPGAAPLLPSSLATLEVQLVRQQETQQGQPQSQDAQQPPQEPAPPAPQPAPPPPAPAPSAAAPPTRPAPPVPLGATDDAPPPSSPPPSSPPPSSPPPSSPPPSSPPPSAPAAPPAPPAPANPYANVPMPAPQPHPAAPPAVNLGNGDEDREGLSVSGDNVVSEGPDARFHNMPPHYPRDAARAHLHGTVALLIHIMPTGAAGQVEVLDTSGVASMDEAAVDAVSRWRFKPAMRDGAPVPSVYMMQFNFVDEER